MTTTETKTNVRVTVEDGWAVRNLPNGDQVRARILVDTMGDTEQPDREGSGVLLIRERDSYDGIALDEHDGLSAVLERTYPIGRGEWAVQNGNEEYLSPDSRIGDDLGREEYVARYLRVFWDVTDAFLFRHRSGGDWADIWVLSTNPARSDRETRMNRRVAESIAREWSDWAKGDCYGFESQTRTLRDALDHGEFGWKDADQCWGYIGDDGARYALAEFLDVAEADVPAPYLVTEY